MNSNVLLAYALDQKGGGQSLENDKISSNIENNNLVWVHLDANNINTKSWLENEVSYLDTFIIDALLKDETRPRMMQLDNGVLLILRGVNLNENSDPEDMVSLRLWIDNNNIISLYKRKLKVISDIEAKIKKNIGPKNVGDFICMIIDGLCKRIDPFLLKLDEITDDIEERILENLDISLKESIADVRKQAIMFKRYMSPQRDAINNLKLAEIQWLQDNHKLQLEESYNHITIYIENLDAIRERAQVVKDEISNINADKLNRNMYVLSVISAIFLPLGFLTGLLGINIGGIPGADNVDAFFIFCVILTIIVLIQVIIFKWFKWF